MDAPTIEETNRLRISLGMKPLPVPGSAAPPSRTSAADRKKPPSSAAADRDGGGGSGGDDDDEPGSTLESRQAQAYDNFRKLKDAEDTKLRRERKAAAARKAREAAQRFALLEGSGLADDDGGADQLDARAWLVGQKKRQKRIDKARKAEEEREAEEKRRAAERGYTAQDLAGVRVAHDVSAMEGDQILTLKDAVIGGDGDDDDADNADELENVDLREAERLKERLELKTRKPGYDPHDEDVAGRTILAQYDDDIYGKKQKKFTLGDSGGLEGLLRELAAGDLESGPERAKKTVNLGMEDEEGVVAARSTSDYLDISELKVKKVRKSKSKKMRIKEEDEDLALAPLPPPPPPPPPPLPPAEDGSMDIDSGAAPKKRKMAGASFLDDDDHLQASLAIHRQKALKKRKKTRPEDLARELREQAEKAAAESQDPDGGDSAGLILGEITEFISGLQKTDEAETKKPKRKQQPQPPQQPAGEQSVTTPMRIDGDDDGDHRMDDGSPAAAAAPPPSSPPQPVRRANLAGLTEAGVEQEKTFKSMGLGSTLAFLRERKFVEGSGGGAGGGDGADRADRVEQDRAYQNFLLGKRRLEEENDEYIKQQRERDRASGRLEKMSTREREDWQRQQNSYRDQQLARRLEDLYNTHYRPRVELSYVDEHGRNLGQKDAFKELSHQFHGRTSGKGKTDKLLKKMADERRREAQSMLDATKGGRGGVRGGGEGRG